ncbi:MULTISPECIES: AAA family ATPase [Aminobacter]|uniref:ATPase AAA n=2 Tax=Aminobacter TaxID=31988 RepID=A0AAC9FDH1_AMIAI|nr:MULTISPECIES: AAA family ATPase [Aminobacter]AMS41293.1 ATPase AAA [Aminobacter aminovorans]MBA8904640.1 energy-coupling factor transporter ATP-binding protein EcfA2 [Aminobacter ciceronei]MBA9018418.1 energy-coupling factor transporter ATP-binding protein EcfA2 [Aminobacter ciceronei]MBB3707860.1 energy-coupling factor transporter ATP-binding protein EcfA2 [Aminobacter aminovorans]MRX32930.1 AAA family ATPase [Aminobacter sp. MDW-2]
MDTGLTTISEADIEKHRATAQSFITRIVVLEDSSGQSGTALAGTNRRFVSTVSTGSIRKTREVELQKTVTAIRPDDQLMSIPQHTLLFRARRGIAVALAVSDVFSRSTDLEALQAKNARSPLEGDEASHFKKLLSASAYVAGFTLASYLAQLIDSDGEAPNDVSEPDFLFDTPQDAVKSIVSGLDRALSGAKDDADLLTRGRAFARTAIEGLLQRKSRFDGIGAFENAHIRIDADDFTLDGFDVAPGKKSKPLVMTFKKPQEVVGNHIAKFQSVRLAKMLMAYDFDRELNPFVELGGFLFTFIGDGAPGTGKTTLIQMIAGLVNNYCQVAGYPFAYENFGVDQISSYQGKSGQNCRQFINNVLNPRAIGFGTIDDIDQVAAKRSDDRASAGQQEITGVLMDAFAGAGTVVRGNCSFGMFSNYPENVDDALRQRAGARWLVDGPQTRDDYIDIFVLLAGKNHKIPLGEHELYAAQEIQRAVTEAYEEHAKPQEDGLEKVYDRFMKDNGAPKTLADVGTYLHMIKEAEPRFTGRAIKNVTDAIKMRAMDIELPDEWFEKPEAFMHKGYDEKKAMIEELRGPFSMDMVMQEINRYADSEFRYSDKSDDAAVSKLLRDARLRERAAKEMEELKAKGLWNA